MTVKNRFYKVGDVIVSNDSSEKMMMKSKDFAHKTLFISYATKDKWKFE